jgi:DNA-binding winged helix-turn-helix (wHTH) protein/tetratricopeptide (TPR) repeat protein
MSTSPSFEFGPFRLDTAKQVLWRDGALVPLTPKALALLRVLVEARGDVVPKPDLMARVWPDAIVEDANLSVTVAVLRRALGTRGEGPSWVETVPRRGYRFAGTMHAPSVEPPLLLAVLPFRSIAAHPEPHVGLGMADALIARLTSVENLRVRPTGAVASYATEPVPPLAAAEALGVDAVLDGSVQRSGDRWRLSVQLVSRRPGLPCWAEPFDAVREDLFAVQDDIAEKVVHALSARLGKWRGAPAWATKRTNPEVWETWLRGCYFWVRLDGEGVSKAVGCFGEAAAGDDDWARPHAGLAGAHVFFALSGLLAPAQAWRLAQECADEALRRDPGLPEAHLARAWTALFRDWGWAEARATVDRAVALGPPELLHWRALLSGLLGDVEQASDALARARESDPLSAAALVLASFLHDVAGDYAEALAVSRRAVELRPDHHLAHWRLGVALSRLGRHEEAIAALGRAVGCSAGGVAMRCELAWALARGGRPDEARTLLAEVDAIGPPMYVSPFLRAKVLAALGEEDVALDQLEQAAEDRDPWVTVIGVDPALDSLRGESRFERLASRILAQAGTASARRPVRSIA